MTYNWHITLYKLSCTMWWFDTCIYCEGINTIQLVNTSITLHGYFFFEEVWTFKIYSPSNFQVYKQYCYLPSSRCTLDLWKSVFLQPEAQTLWPPSPTSPTSLLPAPGSRGWETQDQGTRGFGVWWGELLGLPRVGALPLYMDKEAQGQPSSHCVS